LQPAFVRPLHLKPNGKNQYLPANTDSGRLPPDSGFPDLRRLTSDFLLFLPPYTLGSTILQLYTYKLKATQAVHPLPTPDSRNRPLGPPLLPYTLYL